MQIHLFNTQKSQRITLKSQFIPFQLKFSNHPCIQVPIDIMNYVQIVACIILKWIKISLLKTSIFIHSQYHIPFLWSKIKIQVRIIILTPFINCPRHLNLVWNHMSIYSSLTPFLTLYWVLTLKIHIFHFLSTP